MPSPAKTSEQLEQMFPDAIVFLYLVKYGNVIAYGKSAIKASEILGTYLCFDGDKRMTGCPKTEFDRVVFHQQYCIAEFETHF